MSSNMLILKLYVRFRPQNTSGTKLDFNSVNDSNFAGIKTDSSIRISRHPALSYSASKVRSKT